MLFGCRLGVLHDRRTPPPAKLFSRMCLSPIRIKNPKKNPVLGMDSQFLVVPCGNCPECRMHKQDDWYVRSYFEYQDTLRNGGYVQAITLTYNETSLPRYTKFKLPGFSREHIQKFLKLVRDKVGSNLRFFMSCEYGDEKHRPHYHFLFYCSPSVDRKDLLYAVARSWHYGIIYTSNINDGLIIDVRGIRYVSKYCVKDLLQNDWFLEQRNRLKSLCKVRDSDTVKNPRYKKYIAILKEFEKHRPFIQASMYYGYSAIRDGAFTHEEIVDGYIRLKSYSKPEGDKFKLPLYYERHLLYRRYTSENGSPKFVLTNYGVDVMLARFKKKTDCLEFRLKELCNAVSAPAFKAMFGKYSDVPYSKLISILSPSRSFIEFYANFAKYYTFESPVEMPDSYAFLDSIPTIDIRRHYEDVVYYSADELPEYNPVDGSLYAEIGHDFIVDLHHHFALSEFKCFHELFQDAQEFLQHVANERQREEEKLAIAAKIYKRKKMRSKHSNYLKHA